MDIGAPSDRVIGGRCIVVLFEISTVCVEIKVLQILLQLFFDFSKAFQQLLHFLLSVEDCFGLIQLVGKGWIIAFCSGFFGLHTLVNLL